MNADRAFRVTAWVSLPSEFNALKFRRAMTAMSVDAASPARLEREAGLSRDDLRRLLAALDAAGVLEVSCGAPRRVAGARASESAQAVPGPRPQADARAARLAADHLSASESTLRWMHLLAARHAPFAGRRASLRLALDRLSVETSGRPLGE